MITRFKCKECKEIKIEVWMLRDSMHGDDWCESCRERSKREDTFTFKRFPHLFDPKDPESMEKAKEALKCAYGDTVL